MSLSKKNASKVNIDQLIIDIQELFISRDTDKQVYTEKEQELIGRNLTAIATEVGCFEKQKRNEKNNIEQDLSIIDTKTGETINLVDIKRMRRDVDSVLEKNNVFSILKSLAVANKCAHKFDERVSSLQSVIDEFTDTKEKYKVSKDTPTIKCNVSSLSSKEMRRLLKTLDKNTKNRSYIIAICRQVGIDIEDIKDDEKKLKDVYKTIRASREQMITSYIEKLENEKNLEEDKSASLYWIKDQLIIIISQLLVKDNRYQDFQYEMVKCGGKEGFQNMLAIDDIELSYYIEVHMPDYIVDTLIKDYGLKKPVSENDRLFESLGSSAVYVRNINEVTDIREFNLNNTRARIIARPMPSPIIPQKGGSNYGTDTPPIGGGSDTPSISGSGYSTDGYLPDENYTFITKKIVVSENMGLIERYFARPDANEFERKMLFKYSMMRSNEKLDDIETRIVADSLCALKEELKKEKVDDLSNSKIFKDIKELAIKEINKGDKFDKQFLMYINNEEPDDFLRKISYLKLVEKEYKSIFKDTISDKEREKVNLLTYIGEFITSVNERVLKYSKDKLSKEDLEDLKAIYIARPEKGKKYINFWKKGEAGDGEGER